MQHEATQSRERTASAQLLEELQQEIEHVDNLAGHLEAAANRLIDSHPQGGTGEEKAGVPSANHMNDLDARINRLREARERLESVNAQIERAV